MFFEEGGRAAVAEVPDILGPEYALEQRDEFGTALRAALRIDAGDHRRLQR